MPKIVAIGQRYGFETPIFLKRERPSIHLAATKVEPERMASMGAAHHLPVHEIVCCDGTCVQGPAAIIWQYRVAKVEAQHAADGSTVARNSSYLAILSKYVLQALEIPLCQNGGTEISLARGIDVIESIDLMVDLALQTELGALSDHRALLARNGQHRLLEILIYRAAKGNVKIGAPVPLVPRGMRAAELDVVSIDVLGQLDCVPLKHCPSPVVTSQWPALHAESRGN